MLLQLPAATSLQNGEQFQNEEEQVEYSKENGDGQTNGVRHGISHVFRTLDIENDKAREESNAKERDDQLNEGGMKNAAKEKAQQGSYQQQNKAKEKVITQT